MNSKQVNVQNVIERLNGFHASLGGCDQDKHTSRIAQCQAAKCSLKELG